MRYVGIDYHKHYSVLCATDERGQELKQRRIKGNTAAGFAQFFSELGEQNKVVNGSVLELGLALRSVRPN